MEWSAPVPRISALISWLAVEKGKHELAGHRLIVGADNITRRNKNIDDRSNYIRFDFSKGCEDIHHECRFDGNITVGLVSQLQTLVYNRLLVVRGLNIQRSFIEFLLRYHDSTDDLNFVMTSPEELAYIAFPIGMSVSCIEGINIESKSIQSVTKAPHELRFALDYASRPGLFATLVSPVDVSGRVAVAVSSLTPSKADVRVQEDPCITQDSRTAFVKVYSMVVGS